MGFFTKALALVGVETKGSPLSITDEKALRLWGRALYGDGGPSMAGKYVTAPVAMQLATVWSCVRLISETIGTLPMMLYRDVGDPNRDGREVARDLDLYWLLHESPNADQTAAEFWENVGLNVCLRGNFYAEIIRAGRRIVALVPLWTDNVTISRDQYGGKVYRYADPGDRGRVRMLAEADVFHVKGFGSQGETGLSPLFYGRQTLGLALAAEETAASMFLNGARPSGVLQMDQVLKADQRKEIRENIVEPFSGSVNAGKTVLLEAGMKYASIQLTPEDAQMLQTRAFHVEEICRWFRVPPVVIGHSSPGQTMFGAGVEQVLLGWLTLGLKPYLTRIEQAVKRALLDPADRRSLHPKFDVDDLTRADSVGRAEFYSKMANNGIYTRNELRRRENLPAVEGGDVITTPANLLPITDLGKALVGRQPQPTGFGSPSDPANPVGHDNPGVAA